MLNSMYLNAGKKTVSRFIFLLMFQALTHSGSAQPGYWQQRVKYAMDIDMNVHTNRFTGRQQLDYTNHSPDTLRKVFYHLFWNAFQPNSMMDKRSSSWGANMLNGRQDWDPRVQDRIQHLTPEEI